MTVRDDAEGSVDRPPSRPRLPDVNLPALVGAGATAGAAVRARRQGTVLALLRAPIRERDAAYLRDLAARVSELADWDGRVLAVVSGDPGEAALSLEGLALPFPIVADIDGTIAAAAGVVAPALVVADQWGEVHAAAAAAEDWLAIGDVVDWLKYMSIRCAG